MVVGELLAIRHAAGSGERALIGAESAIAAGRFADARRMVASARGQFASAKRHAEILRSVGDVLPRIRDVDEQLRAMEALSAVGMLTADAARRIVDALSEAAAPAQGARLLDGLRDVATAIRGARASLDLGIGRIDALRGAALARPVRDARSRARRGLARAGARLGSSEQLLAAAWTLLGGDGPRRYLVLSQNPEELRPTGGFIGTYGVLAVRDGHAELTRYAAIERWCRAHPRAVVPVARAPRPLRLPDPPMAQTLANVNATPDWPHSARLAARLWKLGGEDPVDGVIALTPDIVARLLSALGPLHVAGFGPAVTGRNIVPVLDYLTHRRKQPRSRDRKRVVGELAHQIMGRLATRATRRSALVRELVAGMDAREAMVWSSDANVQRMLVERGWNGALPDVRGDFFYDAEFSYPTKNGRRLRRLFEHVVELRGDGSARVTTTITIRNSNPLGYPYEAYLTLYGPRGARLSTRADTPIGSEPAIRGHPAVAWLRFAQPWGTTTVRAAWNVPRLLIRRRDGTLVYRLTWLRVPAHSGDRLRLRVVPPAGWRWARHAPPTHSRLPHDMHGSWTLTRS
jgi:hypothetical protein